MDSNFDRSVDLKSEVVYTLYRSKQMGDEIESEKSLEKNGVKLKTVYASNRSEWVEDSVS